MAAGLVTAAMEVIGKEHTVYLCCDNWYPKGKMLKLVDKFENLDMVCNARSDTVLWELLKTSVFGSNSEKAILTLR